MLRLNEREWKIFRIEDVFDVKGTITTHPSKLKIDGKTPRITCAATDNGLDGFYQNEPTEFGGVLTVDSATIGFIAYQEHDFIATDHVEKLVRKDGVLLNRYTALFVKMCIDNSKEGKFGYGYKFAQRRIKRQAFLLPVINNQPDWQFMEDYMREQEMIILKV